MTRKIEDQAKAFLLTKFSNPPWRFQDKSGDERGFDLWLTGSPGDQRRKIELKATTRAFGRPSHLLERLVFNSDEERQLFESGETWIARVFLGSTPPKVVIITNAILGDSAKLRADERYTIRGRANYDGSYFALN